MNDLFLNCKIILKLTPDTNSQPSVGSFLKAQEYAPFASLCKIPIIESLQLKSSPLRQVSSFANHPGHKSSTGPEILANLTCGNLISGSPLWVTLKSWRYSSSLFNVRLDLFKIARHNLENLVNKWSSKCIISTSADSMEYLMHQCQAGLFKRLGRQHAGQSLFCRQQKFISITTIASKSVQPRECFPSSPASHIDLLWLTKIAFNPTDESCLFYQQQNSS